MTTKVLCPNSACRKSSTGSAELIGRSVRCKHCGYLFVIEATPSPANETRPVDPSPPIPATTSGEVLAAIGRFVIRQRLGAGAFGTVYQAYDPQLDREVAIKLPNAGVLDSPRRIERFLREARAAANLRHPHIVPVYEAGRDGDRYYIASEFIDGTTLAEAIEEGGLEVHRAARLARELAEALAYAHDEGIVHRDVKPVNCMLDRQDRLHLMDFGLAARAEEEARLTNDGAILGTPAYMAPEQAAGQQGEANPAADQYAVGIVLYELLTGHVPFRGPAATVIHHVIHTIPDSPRKYRPFLPKDLETICLKAIGKLPSDRYPDCRALADDLRRWREDEPITARRQSTFERTRRWAKKNKSVAAMSLAVLAALAIGTLVSFSFAVKASQAGRQADERKREAETSLELAQVATVNEAAERVRAEEAGKVAVSASEKAERDRIVADEERKKAVDVGIKLEEERKKAVVAATTAEAERQKATEALANLQAAQSKIQLSELQALESNYAALLSLAFVQLQSKEAAQGVRTLNKCLLHQRGWEWRFLKDAAEQAKPIAKELTLPRN